MTLKTGLGVREGHWKCHHSIAHMTSYWRSISCRFWDIQWRKISRPWNPGHGSIKVIESGTIR